MFEQWRIQTGSKGSIEPPFLLSAHYDVSAKLR